MEERNDLIRESPSESTTIKVSDDSNSGEILVFTSLCNVCKVQKKELIDKLQALINNIYLTPALGGQYCPANYGRGY